MNHSLLGIKWCLVVLNIAYAAFTVVCESVSFVNECPIDISYETLHILGLPKVYLGGRAENMAF